MADTIRQRIADPDAPCDEMLEPLLDAIHRYYWRGTLRRQHALGQLCAAGDWAGFLGIKAALAADLAAEPHFGAFWQRIEHVSQLLRASRLRPADLPLEIRRARGVLAWLRREEAELPFALALAP